MKKVLIFIAIGLLLISFLGFAVARDALRITASTINSDCTDTDDGKDYSIKGTVTTNSETKTDSCRYCTGVCLEGESGCETGCGAVLEFYCDEGVIKNETHVCGDNKSCEEGACVSTNQEDDETNDNEDETEKCEAWTCTKWSACVNNVRTRTCTAVENCTEEQDMPKVSKNCLEKEKLGGKKKLTDCPEECTCSGSTMKCTLASGREMTVIAGKSGNTIVQVKGVNGSTSVTLYKSEDGKLYGVFKGNVTKIIKMLPDQVKDKIREKLSKQLENEDITLSEDGTYEYQGKEKAKLFAFIPVKMMIRAELNPETGEVIKFKKAWWSFLAKEDANIIVGASCGTVSPDSRNECCVNKGYDVWNAEKAECEFNSA